MPREDIRAGRIRRDEWQLCSMTSTLNQCDSLRSLLVWPGDRILNVVKDSDVELLLQMRNPDDASVRWFPR